MTARVRSQAKARALAIIRASPLDWIIVRPTVLVDKPATGEVHAMIDLRGFRGGKISRADVAAFVLDHAGSDEWLRKTPLITGRVSNGR